MLNQDKLNEKEELKEILSKEGDELRKSLLDKLYNLNAILSAVFLVLYQLDKSSIETRVFNILPFFTIIFILFYQLFELRIIGKIYYKIDTWEKDKDIKSIKNHKQLSFNIITISILLTIVELIYLFSILLIHP